jgi:TonB family protein
LLGGGYGSVWVERAGVVLDPSALVVAGAPAAWAGSGLVFIIFSAVWFAGMTWLVFGWTRRRSSIRECGMRPQSNAEPWVSDRLNSALEGTRIPAAAIRVVEGSGLPAVTGVLRRHILVSERMIRELPEDELRAILLHEEEHRRRFDPLRMLVQRLALLFFFYYPPLWALLRSLNSSREMACDEAAIRAGTPPSTFARALARSLNLGLRPAPSPAGLGLEGGSLIKDRFERLKYQWRYRSMKRHTIVIVAAICLVGVVSLIPRHPFALGGDGDQTEPPSPQSAAAPDSGTPSPPVPPSTADQDEVKMPVLKVETRVLPEYPEAERKAGVEGEVIVEVEVTEEGSVEGMKVVQRVDGHPSMGESVMEAIRQWRFEPGTKNGVPVRTTVAIPFTFALQDDEKPGELDTYPELVGETLVHPEYPEDARKAGVSGRVLLEVLVKQDGTPGDITVKEGIAGYPSLDEAAVTAVRQWKFKPATKDGKPAETTVAIPVMFRLDEDKPKETD